MTQRPAWPGWKTVGPLGRGTYAEVYEIERETAGKAEKAALKVIPIPVHRETLTQLREAGNDDRSIAATLEGYAVSIASQCLQIQRLGTTTGIVGCDGVNYVRSQDELGGYLMIKMELLTPLTRYVDGDVSETTVAQIGRELGEALTLCHDNGIIHGGIKPRNIFVTADGHYKLGDIGIAAAVEKTMGSVLGSDPYAAPEIYQGQPASVATDVYALGAVLFGLLNRGQLPIGSLETAPMERGSQALQDVVRKASAKDPANRFASARELVEALNGAGMPAEEIQIRFLFADGEVISSDTYQPGETVEIPPMENEIEVNGVKRVFCGWSAEVERVATKSVDYVAMYETASSGAVAETDNKKGTDRKPVDKKLLAAIAAVAAIVVLLAVLLTGLRGCKKDSGENPPPTAVQDDWGPAPEPPVVDDDDDVPQEVACSHDWIPSTCTSPRICSKCGEINGSANGHDWENATRANPKTCRVCGVTEGEPIAAPDISVSDQIQYVSDEYYEIEDMLYSDQLYREEVRREVYYYYDSHGDIRMVVTAKGNDGIGKYSDQYRRYYYFDNNELIFAFFEGQDNHRMYFYNGELMRWRYQGVGQSRNDAVNEDFTYSDDFLKWERLALQEVASFNVI